MNGNLSDEAKRLADIAQDSWYAKGANAATVKHSTSIFSRYWHGKKSCLEMGPAEGVATEIISKHFADLTLVDGAQAFCDNLKQRFPRATIFHSLFETFNPNRSFDVIVLGHVLEHVESPPAILSAARKWLAPGGIICAAVPNARSLHRQAAVLMGLIKHEHELNESDIHHGHRRVYNPETFRADFLAAGLKIDVFGGYWLKPLSNSQIEATWNDKMLTAFMQLGERYPDIAGELYVIASA